MINKFVNKNLIVLQLNRILNTNVNVFIIIIEILINNVFKNLIVVIIK